MDDNTLHDILLSLLVVLIFAFVFAPQTVSVLPTKDTKIQNIQLTLTSLPDTIFKYMFASTNPAIENNTFGTSYNSFDSSRI
jgi:hypothetical protein